jgi:hypothetical protein
MASGVNTHNLEVRRFILDKINEQIDFIVDLFGDDCPNSPNCNNNGALSHYDGENEPDWEQCQFCYCGPKSKFNLRELLNVLTERNKLNN